MSARGEGGRAENGPEAQSGTAAAVLGFHRSLFVSNDLEQGIQRQVAPR